MNMTNVTLLYPDEDRKVSKMLEWCTEQFGAYGQGERWNVDVIHLEPHLTFAFRDPADAMIFKLAWGGQ